MFGEQHWAEPVTWDRSAAKAGVRRRVFCASMADVFDPEAPDSERLKLWRLIGATPNLDWLLLTKRPQLAGRYLPWMRMPLVGEMIETPQPPWPNVWVGTTCEDQERADLRIPALLKIPAVVCFLSVEPLLAPVDLSRWVFDRHQALRDACIGPAALNIEQADAVVGYPVDWVICGGESGPGARDCQVVWIRSIVEQCRAANVPCFVKQLGARALARSSDDEEDNLWSAVDASENGHPGYPYYLPLRSTKGGDPGEWPMDLRVREFPRRP